ncbi:hypothetical protein P245_15145 [Comamonas thiooxydans]|uniref:Uncharacterized protein n=1 Tax=Comamonas thiooxydans TaxID=363952 RepID=A0A0E3C181_9BURK|nr:hypothetical protein [Comamonas thiooxydans]KGG90821.1 hypothetical protein P245_15145 [Comamonas thiooxydans]
MWRIKKLVVGDISIILVLSIGTIIMLAMFAIDQLRCFLIDAKYKDLAPWIQAVASVMTIIAAVFIARIPIEQSNKEKEELKNKNIQLFWDRAYRVFKHDLNRIRHAKNLFSEMKENFDDPNAYSTSFTHFVRRVMMMNTHAVTDYSAAYDYSKSLYGELLSAQDNLISIKRQMTKSDLVDEDINSSNFAINAYGKEE